MQKARSLLFEALVITRRAASLVEYLVVVGLVALGAIGAFIGFSSNVGHAVRCEGARVLSLGASGSCSDSKASAPAVVAKAGTQTQANTSGMVCTALGCKGNGNCFVAGTPVAVPEGHRAIETLHDGDVVLARDEKTGELAPRAVVGTKKTPARALVEIDVVSDHGASHLRVTPEHPFYVAAHGWTGAAWLDVGSEIVSTSGVAVVTRLASLTDRADVFNIEVDGLHTYFVGEADALVHNDCKDDARAGMPISEPRLRVVPPGEKAAPGMKPAGDNGGFALQRRAIPNGDKIVGEPTNTVDVAQDASREARAAEKFAARPDVEKVYLGQEAEEFLKGLAKKRGTPFPNGNQQFPDVVGVKTDGKLILGEGKGGNVAHAGDQFGNAGKHVGTEVIAEQWVFTPKAPVDRAPSKGGFLEQVVKTTEPGKPLSAPELKALRSDGGGAGIEIRDLPDGGKEYVRLWKPNGVKVQWDLTPEQPVAGGKPAPAPVAAPEPAAPKVVPEPAAPKVAVTEPAPVAPKPAAAPEPAAVAPKGGTPSIGAQLANQGAGVGLSVVAGAAGKIVEKETGSPLAGTATGLGVGAGGTVLIAKATGAGVVKSVGGGLVTGLAATGVREGVKYTTGSQTAGDISGYATAGAIGAGFGGPIGAGGAVVAMAASDLAAAGVDIYYAGKEGERLEDKRQELIVRRAFAAVQSRDVAKEGIDLKFFKNLAKTPEGTDRLYKLLAGAGPSQDIVNKIFTTHLGRAPTQAESDAARTQLEKGAWLSDIESNVILINAAYGSILGRAPDAAGTATWLNQLGRGMSREDFLKAIANSDEGKQAIGNVFQSTLGRAPTPDELKAAQADLASGIGLRKLQEKLAQQKK